MAAKEKSWLGEFWRPLAALLLWVLGMVPLIAAPPLLPSVAETRIGGLAAFPDGINRYGEWYGQLTPRAWQGQFMQQITGRLWNAR